jgi:hypothetical protein
MIITVKISKVYGVDTIYPVCHKAKLLAQLANTKTLTRDAIKSIKELGYEISIQQPTITL